MCGNKLSENWDDNITIAETIMTKTLCVYDIFFTDEDQKTTLEYVIFKYIKTNVRACECVRAMGNDTDIKFGIRIQRACKMQI